MAGAGGACAAVGALVDLTLLPAAFSRSLLVCAAMRTPACPLLLLAATLLAPALEAADGGNRPPPRPRVVNAQDGYGTDDQADAMGAAWSFGEMDANGDGKISPAELAEGRQGLEKAIRDTKAGMVQYLDKDNSGKLSKYEASEAKGRVASLNQQARALALATYDKDGDGKLSDKERETLEARMASVLASSGARIDANGDRRVSREEAFAAVDALLTKKRTLFSLCDKNNDGQISQQELELYFALLRAAAGI